MPTMLDQRILGPLIDPVCGAYCLKALLKHHFERIYNKRPDKVEIPRSTRILRNIAGFDPYYDFKYAKKLLHCTAFDPAYTHETIVKALKQYGPIIISGKGLGHAGRSIGHVILLVGGSTLDGKELLHFKDPLRGDDIFTEEFSQIKSKLPTMVFGKDDIGVGLQELREPGKAVEDLIFLKLIESTH